jgi:hypothetical protein
MGVDQWRERPEVLSGQSLHPRRIAEHLLDHQRVDVDQRDLEEVEAEDRDLLILQTVRRDLPALAVKDEALGPIPAIDDVERLLHLTTQRLRVQIPAQEGGLDRLAKLGQRLVRRKSELTLPGCVKVTPSQPTAGHSSTPRITWSQQ